MALKISDDQITSDQVGERAYRQDGLWWVTGRPGRAFDRNQAITAMTIAEEHNQPYPNAALIDSLESELR
jgi:hypothetical protein